MTILSNEVKRQLTYKIQSLLDMFSIVPLGFRKQNLQRGKWIKYVFIQWNAVTMDDKPPKYHQGEWRKPDRNE